jgi:hypothetical protein
MQPAGFGQPRKCGFTDREWSHGLFFTSENWNCETLNALRDIAVTHVNPDDRSIGIVWLPESDDTDSGWIVLTWYKRRGSVGSAIVMNEDSRPRELTLELAETAIARYHAGVRLDGGFGEEYLR